MNPASIDDIKNELKQLPPKKVLDLTLRLARFKKENKELLTYLLFESHDEPGYIKMLQADIDEKFATIDPSPVSKAKKEYRKILRLINRQIKYIGSKSASVELLLYFTMKLRDQEQTLHPRLQTLFLQQITKAEKLLPLIDDDLQFDYRQKIEALRGDDVLEKPVVKRWWKGIRRKT
jgi:hypothetical protein